MKKSFLGALIVISAFSCKLSNTELKQGNWLINFNLKETQLPLQVTINLEDSTFIFYNASEKIIAKDLSINGDSLIVQLPYFDAALKAKIWQSDLISGYYYDYSRPNNYRIPFKGKHGKQKFNLAESKTSLANSYQLKFGKGDKQYPAVAKLTQQKNKVTGTILTETGDYRFLDGFINNDTLKLHTFDGSHVFVFEAIIKDDSLTKGIFYSGNHYSNAWCGVATDSAKLTDPYELTSVVNEKPINFSCINPLNKKQVSLSDAEYQQSSVKIIQILGTWCPNCLDETKYLAKLHNDYQSKGLKIIGLAFERDTNLTIAAKRILKYKDDTGAAYPILLAGRASKKEAGKLFPQLNKIISFPTTLFLNQNNEVIKIHTGFNGPGTDNLYREFTEQTETFLDSLLQKKELN